MTPRVRLSSRFYWRPPEVLARALLGTILVHGDRAGIIVETEAYLGPEDMASHARFGATRRTRVMFGPGGMSYVYLCYGMYHMFNVVSGRDGEPGAVLIRAMELLPARSIAMSGAKWPGPLTQKRTAVDPATARGPGKLTRALSLTREHSGIDLVTHDRLYLTAGRRIGRDRVAHGPRVGIDYAGSWVDAPLRFWIIDHPAVSRPPTGRRDRPKPSSRRRTKSTNRGSK